MKKQLFTFLLLASFTLQAFAYDFQSGDLLYTITSTNSPQVRLVGHVDGVEAVGELVIPEIVDFEGVYYTVIEIGKNAFNGCTGLTGRLVIPQTVRKIDMCAFKQCSGFSGDLDIPDSVDTIMTAAFRDCSGFDGHLHIPGNMKRIYMETFSGCSGLIGTLNIPDSVTEIDADAFSYCSGFTGTLVIPDSVTDLSVCASQNSSGAFAGCTGLTGLVLPDSLHVIGYHCFAGTGLSGELVFPSGITEVGYGAFADCLYLIRVVLDEGLEYIGRRAFANSGIEGDLVFPSSVKEIDDWAFQDCARLNSICFRDAPERLGNGAFSFCSNLLSASLPEGLEETGPNLFSGCINLSFVQLPSSLTTIKGGCFDGCTTLTKIDFPENLTTIGEKAFRRSGLIGALVLPKSVETIEAFAFCETDITKVVLGDSLKELLETAFCLNPSLNTVHLRGIVPPSFHPDDQVTFQMQRDIPIIVPCGTQETYQNTPGWNVFSNIHDGIAFLFSAVSSDESAGTVNILKEATCEDRTVEVEALPNDGREFMYWEANGERVSIENPYSFTLEEDTELVAYFSGTGLDEMEQLFKVFPNPTSSQVTITGRDLKSAEVFNTLGQHVATASSNGERLSVDLSGLPAGIYFVNVTDKEGKNSVRKVLKQ